MTKSPGRRPRRTPVERSVTPSLRRPNRGQSQPSSIAIREMVNPRLLSPTAKQGGKPVRNVKPLPFGLGRVAKTLPHFRSEQFKVLFENTRQLARKYPLQAMFVGVGLGYLLSRAGKKTIPG